MYMTTAKFRTPDKHSREFQKKLESFSGLGIIAIEPLNEDDVVFSIVIPAQNIDWIDELSAFAFDLGGDLFQIS